MKSFRAPSWANIWTRCSAFPKLAEGTEDLGKDSEARILGTEVHNSVVSLHETGAIDAHSDEFAVPFLDLVKNGSAQYGVETPFAVNWLPGQNSEGGRADAWSISHDGKTLTVYELKTGYYPVPAKHNMQTLIAGLTLSLWFPGVETISNVVFQPRSYAGLSPVSSWAVPRDSFGNWVSVLQSCYTETLEKPVYRTGERCCACFARYACPAFQQQVTRILDLELPYSETQGNAGEIGAELTILRQAKRKLEKRIEALTDLATYQLNSGIPVLGWHFQPGKAYRAWIDPHATRLVLDSCGIKSNTDNLITPAEAERRGAPKNLVNELTERKQKISLAPISIPSELE